MKKMFAAALLIGLLSSTIVNAGDQWTPEKSTLTFFGKAKAVLVSLFSF